MLQFPRLPRAAATQMARRVPPLAWIMLAGLALRAALTPLYARLPNGYLDEGFWKEWMRVIDEHGVLNIFRASSYNDYVGYHWVLWLLSVVYGWIGGPYTQTTPSLHILVKAPPIGFDMILIVVVYLTASTLARECGRAGQARAAGLVAAAVIALHPAVVYDSAVWAQTDAAVTVGMLASVVLVSSGRPASGWGAWALGFAVKPHPVIIVPLLLLLTARSGGRRALAIGACAAAATAAAVLAPWIAHGDLGRIIDVYRALFRADYGRLSASAWNVWWFRDVAAHPRPEDAIVAWAPVVTYRLAGAGLSAAAGALALGYAWVRPGLRGALVSAAYLAFAFFMLPISTHERYDYPFVALLLPVAVLDRRWLWLYIPVSLTLFANMFAAAPPFEGYAERWVESPFSLAVAAANALLFAAFSAALAAVVVRAVVLRRPTMRRPAQRDVLAAFGRGAGE